MRTVSLGETDPGTTTIAVERGVAMVVIRRVPAQACSDCGEDYLDEATMREVEREAETAVASGAERVGSDFRVAC